MRQSRRKFPRRHIFVSSPNHTLQGDLADFSNISRHNKNIKYVLFIIDAFSRYGIAVPLHNKRGITVSNALDSIFSQHSYRFFTTDMGSEFISQHAKSVYKKYDVVHFSTHGGTKACMAERLILTIKRMMYRYFEENNTRKYIDILPALMENYNSNTHTSIKCSPNEARNLENREKIWRILHPIHNTIIRKNKFKLGQHVRIQLEKEKFAKGYKQTFSDEIFEIYEIIRTRGDPITYKLIDIKDEVLKGIFYEPELQQVHKTDVESQHRFEKILKRKRKGPQQQFLVKFRGLPIDQSVWLSQQDVKLLRSR